MKRIGALLLVLVLALAFSGNLQEAVLRVVLKGQDNAPVQSMLAGFNWWLSFAIPFCACVGLVAGFTLYGEQYSLCRRLAIMLVPMLLTAAAAIWWKKTQLRQVSWRGNELFGLEGSSTLQAVGLPAIPWCALVAGLVVWGIAVLIARRTEQK